MTLYSYTIYTKILTLYIFEKPLTNANVIPNMQKYILKKTLKPQCMFKNLKSAESVISMAVS